MPPQPIDTGHNLHSLAMRGHPLGVECRGCGRRALALADRVETGRGNMKLLQDLKFVCSACGSREWSGWLFVKQAEVDAFLGNTAGGPAF